MMHQFAELVRIPLADVKFNASANSSLLRVISLAQTYSKLNEPINTLPVIVVREAESYRLISGSEIYSALAECNAEWILALRLPPSPEHQAVWSHETGDQVDILNICQLSPELFEAVFSFLRTHVKSLSKIDVEKLAAVAGRDPLRRFWGSLDVLTGLKCGITKSSLVHLRKYLETRPEHRDAITAIDINNCPEDALAKQLDRLALEPDAIKLASLDRKAIARKIASDADRRYWSDYKDLAKAKHGLVAAMEPLIAKGFFFAPQPPPFPNTSRCLLGKLTLASLRADALSRGYQPKGLTKAQLIDLLCSSS